MKTLMTCTLVLSLVSADGLCAPPTAPEVSKYAPAEDLLQQVDFFIGRVSESLSDPADFDEARQARTLKDANTLAVLALVLGLHDTEHAAKASTPALLAASQQLAAAGADAAKAQQALAQIKLARAGMASSTGTLKWEKVADLPVLMKHVPLIHSGLKRGVEPNRLARQASVSAGQAAALAAIAEASRHDLQYAKTPAAVEAWTEYCVAMRDAAGAVNRAVHAQDAAAVATGMKQMLQSCEACHAKFRHE